jgi:hypothetical protein
MHVKYPPGAVRKLTRRFALVVAFFVAVSHLAQTQEAASTSAPQKIILDTDIGGDIDDAFALALALSSPDIELLGVTTAWGDTQTRARLVDRLLCETGMQSIPVRAGVSMPSTVPINQARWAEAFPKPAKPYASARLYMAADSPLSEANHAGCHRSIHQPRGVDRARCCDLPAAKANCDDGRIDTPRLQRSGVYAKPRS